ncbi:bifunctional oligoribonuclease/PAP phosphatase NrnA [Patescibacteria group bacterium]
MEQEFKKAASLFNQSKHVLIISHRQPDGDSVGANLALGKVLKLYFGMDVTCACADPLPFSLKFLPGSSVMKKTFDENGDIDLIVSVDCSSKDQMKFFEIKPDFFKKDIPLINIDHHASNKNYGSVNLVDADAASTTVILYEFIKFLQIPIISAVATNLLAGIYCDTGCFMHANTNADTYLIASDLMQAGASANEIVKYMFKTKTVEQLRLWGKVLANIKVNNKGTILSKITSDELNELKAAPKDLSGIINYLNSVPNCKMSILLSEDLKGNVQGSLRAANDDIDVSKVSSQFGGGGHKKAAGFTIPGKIVIEEVWRIEE